MRRARLSFENLEAQKHSSIRFFSVPEQLSDLRNHCEKLERPEGLTQRDKKLGSKQSSRKAMCCDSSKRTIAATVLPNDGTPDALLGRFKREST